MSISCYKKSGVEIIVLEGNIQQNEADELEDILHMYLENNLCNILIDLQKVKSLGSAALGLMVSYKKIFFEKHGDLKLVVDSPHMAELFKVTMLNKVFDISDMLQDALNSFQK